MVEENKRINKVIEGITDALRENGIAPNVLGIVLQQSSSKLKDDPETELALLRRAEHYLSGHHKN